jgi:hypothetical protein
MGAGKLTARAWPELTPFIDALNTNPNDYLRNPMPTPSENSVDKPQTREVAFAQAALRMTDCCPI